MRRKPTEIKFRQEVAAELEATEAKVGQQVPLSMRYVLGPRPTLVSIDGETATRIFPDDARVINVPLRALVDDSGCWTR